MCSRRACSQQGRSHYVRYIWKSTHFEFSNLVALWLKSGIMSCIFPSAYARTWCRQKQTNTYLPRTMELSFSSDTMATMYGIRRCKTIPVMNGPDECVYMHLDGLGSGSGYIATRGVRGVTCIMMSSSTNLAAHSSTRSASSLLAGLRTDLRVHALFVSRIYCAHSCLQPCTKSVLGRTA